MSDERLDKLGTYFVHFNIHEKFGITFERFVKLVTLNRWIDYVA